MGWLEGIGAWLLKQLLQYLTNLAVAEVKRIQVENALAKERGETNEANSKAYEEAVDRVARRQAALDLLNRTRPH